MIGRLVLVALQFIAGWAATPFLERYIQLGGNAQTFVRGAIAAAVIWVVGLVGAQALKDVGTPSPATLTWALLGGLVGAALIVFRVPQMFQIALPAPPLTILLVCAMIGYHLKR